MIKNYLLSNNEYAPLQVLILRYVGNEIEFLSPNLT